MIERSEIRKKDTVVFPLAMAGKGDKLRMFLLHGGKNLEARLTSLGLNHGSKLIVSQSEGRNIVILRGESRIAIGKAMAHKIMVIPD